MPRSLSAESREALQGRLQQAGAWPERFSGVAAEPVLLTAAQDGELQKIGYRLSLFRRASWELYHASVAGRQPAWVAEYVERGATAAEVGRLRERDLATVREAVLQPEMMLTAQGWRLVSLASSVPVAEPAVALAQEYAGGGFDTIRPRETEPLRYAGADWLARPLWLALFRLRPLYAFWRRELSERQLSALGKLLPMAWLVDPSPLPPYAVLPELEVENWDHVAGFRADERRALLLQNGSGPRVCGGAVSAPEWQGAVRRALERATQGMYVLQRAPEGETVRFYPQYRVREGRVGLEAVGAAVRERGGGRLLSAVAVG